MKDYQTLFIKDYSGGPHDSGQFIFNNSYDQRHRPFEWLEDNKIYSYIYTTKDSWNEMYEEASGNYIKGLLLRHGW